MRFWGVILVLVLLAAPGWAADHVWEPDTLKAGTQSEYKFTATTDSQRGLEVKADVVSIVIGFEQDMDGGGGTGGSATIYACSTQGSSTAPLDFADCNFLASCAANSQECYKGSPLPGFLGVDVTGDPTGTARIRVRAGSNVASAGGGGIPGLTGSIGNDATLAYLMTEKFVADAEDLIPIWVSADAVDVACQYKGNLPQGNDDTGDGSEFRPIRSLGRVLSLAARGGFKFIFDSCDNWDTNDGGAAGDNESTNFLLSDGGGTNDTFRMGAPTHCNETLRLCNWYVASDRARKPIISPDMYDGGNGPEGSAFFFDDDDAFADRGGWNMFDGLQFGTATEPYPHDTDCNKNGDLLENVRGQIIFRDVRAYMCGSLNEVWTSHNTGTVNGLFIAINTECILPAGFDAGGLACFFSIGANAVALIGSSCDMFRVNTGAASGHSCVRVEGDGAGTQQVYAFVYAHRSQYHNTADTDESSKYHFLVGSLGATALQQEMVVARSKAIGGGENVLQDAMFSPAEVPVGTENYVFTSFRNSSISLDAYADFGGLFATTGIQMNSICHVHHAGAAGLNRLLALSGNCALLNFNIRDNYFEEASGVISVVEGTNYGTITSGATGFCDDAPSLQGCNTAGTPPNAWSSCTGELIDLTSDPFAGGGGPIGVGMSNQTNNDCGEDLPVTFKGGLYFPPFLLDGRTSMTGVVLAGNGQPVGP